MIKNMETLISKGNISGRKKVLEIVEAGLRAADPYPNTRKLIRVEDGKLIVGYKEFDVIGKGTETFDLSEIGNIYVLGAGKTVQKMAKAIEDVLGDRLTGGAINVKKGEGKYLKRIEVNEAAHPLPDEKNVKGAERIVEIAKAAKEGDLVFCVFSDGVSALLTLPAPGISLEDIRKVTYLLQIDRGAPTEDLNVVRDHLSAVKQGRIALYIHPARMINVLMCMDKFSREIMDHGSFIPSIPPSGSTFKDAINVLKKWGAWEEAPQSVRTFFETADPRYEIPMRSLFEKIPYSVFQPMHMFYMMEGAKKKAEELGLNSVITSSSIRAEAREVGKVMAGIAREIELHGRPFKPPSVLISSGEMIVTVGREIGQGGRNQEFVLSAAQGIRGSKNITIASIDSDGTDGPGTQYIKEQKGLPCMAGGIVDGYTQETALRMGVDIFDELRRHNSSKVLSRLESAIFTGNTGTCTGDLSVILIAGRANEQV